MMFDEIMQKAAEEPLVKSEVDAFCAQEAVSIDAFCDALARRITTDYAKGDLPFLFCDSVANHIFSFMIAFYQKPPPEFAYSVFLAFDQGEYRRAKDPVGSSLEELYTKPMIAMILGGEPVT